ncbi:MAG TPA: hypothetical protein VG146_01545 [Verrucomicrobiae bacterium]|nr:hypothetical protein [Verrucomicrobiae bacterium]
MMEYQEQLKLQAHLDGELSEAEARQVVERLGRDPEAASLFAELSQTREAVAGFEQGITLPETREFYWSKIERDIRRVDRAGRDEAPVGVLALWQRLLVPATGLVLVALACFLGIRSFHFSTPAVETAVTDAGTFTYHDSSAGATLVWLSYPAEREIPGEDEFTALQ